MNIMYHFFSLQEPYNLPIPLFVLVSKKINIKFNNQL